MTKKRPGLSYEARVIEVNRIYDQHVRSGLSNREIWRRWIYPRFHCSERTFYNLLKAPANLSTEKTEALWPEFDFKP